MSQTVSHRVCTRETGARYHSGNPNPGALRHRGRRNLHGLSAKAPSSPTPSDSDRVSIAIQQAVTETLRGERPDPNPSTCHPSVFATRSALPFPAFAVVPCGACVGGGTRQEALHHRGLPNLPALIESEPALSERLPPAQSQTWKLDPAGLIAKAGRAGACRHDGTTEPTEGYALDPSRQNDQPDGPMRRGHPVKGQSQDQPNPSPIGAPEPACSVTRPSPRWGRSLVSESDLVSITGRLRTLPADPAALAARMTLRGGVHGVPNDRALATVKTRRDSVGTVLPPRAAFPLASVSAGLSPRSFDVGGTAARGRPKPTLPVPAHFGPGCLLCRTARPPVGSRALSSESDLGSETHRPTGRITGKPGAALLGMKEPDPSAPPGSKPTSKTSPPTTRSIERACSVERPSPRWGRSLSSESDLAR